MTRIKVTLNSKQVVLGDLAHKDSEAIRLVIEGNESITEIKRIDVSTISYVTDEPTDLQIALNENKNLLSKLSANSRVIDKLLKTKL